MKLLGSTENKVTKDKNDKNVPHLETTEIVFINRFIVILLIIIMSKIQEYYMHLFQINGLAVS